MRRDPAASHHSTRGAVHLMNREIRAPNGENLSGSPGQLAA